MIRKILLVIMMVLGPTVLQAQIPTIEINKSYNLAWDWDQGTGTAASGFKIEVNGVEQALDPPVGSASRSVNLPGPTACGLITLRVGAYNASGTSWSTPLTAQIVGCPPNAPTNLRITVVISQEADGSFRLKLEQVTVK
jgi:hypothetical protein